MGRGLKKGQNDRHCMDFNKDIIFSSQILVEESKNEQKWSKIFSQVTYNLAPVRSVQGRMTQKTAPLLEPRKIGNK